RCAADWTAGRRTWSWAVFEGAAPMKLTGRLVPVAAVTAAQREAMWRLMDRHYADVCRDSFEHDLAEKEWVIQVFDAAGELCGFSTQMLLEVSASGRPIRALVSGDTIIDRERWGAIA